MDSNIVWKLVYLFLILSVLIFSIWNIIQEWERGNPGGFGIAFIKLLTIILASSALLPFCTFNRKNMKR